MSCRSTSLPGGQSRPVCLNKIPGLETNAQKPPPPCVHPHVGRGVLSPSRRSAPALARPQPRNQPPTHPPTHPPAHGTSRIRLAAGPPSSSCPEPAPQPPCSPASATASAVPPLAPQPSSMDAAAGATDTHVQRASPSSCSTSSCRGPTGTREGGGRRGEARQQRRGDSGNVWRVWVREVGGLAGLPLQRKKIPR